MSRTSEEWEEVGDRVFVRRHRNLHLNAGAICGDGAVLVVDTRCHDAEARDLRTALRRLTAAPPAVVNTHAHFDHCFGNRVFLPAAIWGQRGCAADLRDTGEAQRRAMMDAYPEMSDALAAVEIVPPDHLVDASARLDVGGRRVDLVHLGRGHTDHDLCVVVPDAGCVFAGDLLEEGSPPAYDDAWPLEWPDTVERLLRIEADALVPGHGLTFTRAAAAAQREDLAAMAALCAAVMRGELDADGAVRRAPFPPPVAGTALRRALRAGS